MIDFTQNPIIPADYKSRGRGLPYEASPFPCPLFFEELEVCVAHGAGMQLHVADVADAR